MEIENKHSWDYQPKIEIEFETIESIKPQYRMWKKSSLLVKGKFDKFMFAKLLCEMVREYSIEELNETLIRENNYLIIEKK